ncbi:MAG: helix-turn-helix domain-containing protein [Actinomycetaceae bacterium]|nr:helix-turn-helix domain-containing protein [Actinomycetaceae bacterium]
MSAASGTLTPYERVVQALEQGGTIPAIARNAHVSPAFAQSVVEHFQRLGRTGEASSLCSSGLGLCSPQSASKASPEATIACAGCPLAR